MGSVLVYTKKGYRNARYKFSNINTRCIKQV